MSASHTPRPHGAAVEAEAAQAGQGGGRARPGLAGHAVAFPDVLAAQLHARGWTGYMSTPAGRLAFLSVPDRCGRTEDADVIAVPEGHTGQWWYWFSWAERIAPADTPAEAADAIISACQRPADEAQAPAADGHGPGPEMG
jgi:hypothetical protein